LYTVLTSKSFANKSDHHPQRRWTSGVTGPLLVLDAEANINLNAAADAFEKTSGRLAGGASFLQHTCADRSRQTPWVAREGADMFRNPGDCGGGVRALATRTPAVPNRSTWRPVG
jgi:hypothetical protein